MLLYHVSPFLLKGRYLVVEGLNLTREIALQLLMIEGAILETGLHFRDRLLQPVDLSILSS